MAANINLFNPFPGLRPFEAHENHLFFGRDGQSDELLARLRRNRFLAVVGTSGSGKSSLVRAGMLPALQGGMMSKAGSRWRIAVMRPGNQPIANMAFALNAPNVFGSGNGDAQLKPTLIETSLRRGMVGLIEAVEEARLPSKENLLLVIDQFEELFRFKRAMQSEEGENESAAFVKLFLEAARQSRAPIYVVLTMRSDYLGDCAQFQNLPEAINDGQYLIPRMTREQRRQAITGPVAVGGSKIISRLVNRLLNDVGDNPDQLPILQHALMRTWDYWVAHRKNGEPIDLHHYEAIGGMANALSLHADEAYHELLSPQSQITCEKLFKALTEKGQDNREIRRPVILSEASALAETEESEVKTIVEIFRRPGRTFLMPPADVPLRSQTLIDISHESLIRNWERLKKWVDEEAQSAQTYRRLAETAKLHTEGRAGLWRDPDLHIALDWRKQSRPNRVWAQRYAPQFDSALRFLEDSQIARDKEIAEKEAARQRELQQAQALAEEQRKRAEAEREKAEEQKRAAGRLRRRAVALFFVMLVAVAAALLAFVLYEVAEKQKQEAERERNRALAAEDSAKAARDAEALARQKEAEQRQEAERQRLLAEERRNEALRAKNLAEERRRRADSLKVLADQRRYLADSLRVEAEQNYQRAEDNHREAVRLRRISTALLLASQVPLQRNDTLAVLLARCAYYLNLNNGGYDQTEIYEALREALNRPSFDDAGGPLVRRHEDWGEAVAFSPDGEWVASGGADSSVVLWNLQRAGRAPLSFRGHNASVNSVAFNPKGNMLASASDDHTVRLWNAVRDGEALRVFNDHRDRVWSVAYSSGGQLLASGAANGAIIVWNLEQENSSLTHLSGHKGSVRSVAFSPDGLTLASGGTDAVVRLWNLASSNHDESKSLTQESRVRSLAFSPSGQLLAVGCEDWTVRMWDMHQLERGPRILRGHEGRVNAVAFSPNGNFLASASADRSARVWSLERLSEAPALSLPHEQWVWSVSFSPDGKHLATACSDKSIRVWVSNSETLVEFSLAKVDRQLTEKEWTDAVGGEIPYEPEQLRPKELTEK